MHIVEFTKEYTHYIKGTARWTAQPGEFKTLDRDAANYIVNHQYAGKFVGEGCGCIGVDQALIERHTALSTRGVTQEEEDQTDDEEIEAGTIEPATTKADGLWNRKGKK
jgi:hypothetical protein